MSGRRFRGGGTRRIQAVEQWVRDRGAVHAFADYLPGKSAVGAVCARRMGYRRRSIVSRAALVGSAGRAASKWARRAVCLMVLPQPDIGRRARGGTQSSSSQRPEGRSHCLWHGEERGRPLPVSGVRTHHHPWVMSRVASWISPFTRQDSRQSLTNSPNRKAPRSPRVGDLLLSPLTNGWTRTGEKRAQPRAPRGGGQNGGRLGSRPANCTRAKTHGRTVKRPIGAPRTCPLCR
jgi:hypothetical protein